MGSTEFLPAPLPRQARTAVAAHVLERCFEQHWAPPRSPIGYFPAPSAAGLHHSHVIQFALEATNCPLEQLYAWLSRIGYRWDARGETWDLPGDSPLWNLVDVFRPQYLVRTQEIAIYRQYAQRAQPPAGSQCFSRKYQEGVSCYVLQQCFIPLTAARTINLLTLWKTYLRRVIPATLAAARWAQPQLYAWLATNGYSWNPALGWCSERGLRLPKPREMKRIRLQLVQALAGEPSEVPEGA